jgi:YidC/Oxa1 family membrane protein insertase
VVLTAATVRFASWSSWNSWPSSTSPTPATNATPVQTPQTTPTTVDETASAATNPLPTPPIPEQQAPVETAADIDIATPLDTLNNFLVNASSVSPDQIGYLQSLGIQYSRFRPTGLMEFVMEHIHVYSGTPWWATIALTAVAVRCVFFIPFVKAAENNTRMQAIMPLTKPLTDKMTAAAKARDQAAVMEHRSAIQQIHRRAGVSILKGFYPALQFFPAMGTFFLIREMAKIPVPELQTGGMLWFKDLSVQDPYFILPIAASAMLHLVLRVRRYHDSINELANSFFNNRKAAKLDNHQP